MPAPDSTYPPLDVPKTVASGVWVVDSGPIRVLGLRLPIRMTVLRVGEGLLLHSPTRYDRGLHTRLAALGPIRHLVAPNLVHWMHLRDWQLACPDVTVSVAPGLAERRPVRRSGLRIDRVLGDRPPPDWAEELDQLIVAGGGGFRELAFLHRPTHTLVLTDLVQNLEPEKLPRPIRPLARLLGVTAPDGRAPAYLRALVALRRREAAPAAARLLAWAPERVIFAHGRWFERDGTEALRRSLRWLLRGRAAGRLPSGPGPG